MQTFLPYIVSCNNKTFLPKYSKRWLGSRLTHKKALLDEVYLELKFFIPFGPFHNINTTGDTQKNHSESLKF